MWPDWKVAHIWPMIRSRQEVHPFLPVDEMEAGTYPDRTFFWGVICTKLPAWTAAYHAAVMEKKHANVVSQLNDKKIIKVASHFSQKLNQFNFKSSSK